ncbi:thioesterase II family protein [Nonomuraea sp. NPDC050556]|uniref:thioesterase II family protein n=1 Tax=Nonomuraea sp. NPDC050556 TaxID=3364369 RepID=UPI003797DB69
MKIEENMTIEPWFRRFAPAVAHPRTRLVCLPHAGGGASLFRSWPQRLASDVDLLAVRYPGRQDRFLEPCVTAMPELVRQLVGALEPFLDESLVLFGHSMGASVAYEIALSLRQEHGVEVQSLLVSGQTPPHRPRRRQIHHLDDESLIAEIGRLGQLDADALADPGLRELAMPSIRADLKLVETHSREAPAVLNVPVVAYTGTADVTTPLPDVRHWADVTTGDFALVPFPGDHFYLVDQEAQLLADIHGRLTGVPARR